MYIFCYGSNMNPSRMVERNVKFKSYQYGILQHYKLRSNKISQKQKQFAFANIEPYYEDNVFGVLYDVGDDKLKTIDKSEGYPNHYEKTIVPILTNDGFKMALVYIATRLWANENDFPMSVEYKELILNGIKHCESLIPKDDERLLEQFIQYKNKIKI